jgi:hypothetical protein
MHGKRTIRPGILVVLALIAACSDVSGPGEQPAIVTVSAPAHEIAIGGTVQLSAAVLNATGAVMGGQQVQWASADQAVASVSPGGLVTGVGGGTVEIRATSGPASGTISLVVRGGPCSAGSSAGSLAVGQNVTGTLTAASCILPHGNAGIGWRVSVPSATSVRITMQASGFDPLIVATDLNLTPLGFGGPLGPGGTAELLQSFGPGEYMVWATSIDGRLGSFTLSAVEARIEACSVPPRPVAVGQTVSGTISSGSCRMANGKFADPWQLTLTSAATLVIDMMSNQIDTYLLLTDAEGRILGVDDDGGFGTDSRLVHQFAPGTYTIWATTYSPGEVGSYQLSVRPAQGGSLSSVRTESAAPAKRGWPTPAEGRVGPDAVLQPAGMPAGR